MIDVGHGAFDVVKFGIQLAADIKATDEEQATRRKACESCTATDSKGDRVFRAIDQGVFSCGVPVNKKLFRDKAVDGCGCWLNLKWLAKDEKCPLKEARW